MPIIRAASERDVRYILDIVTKSPEENFILIADLTQLRDWCDIRVSISDDSVDGIFSLYQDLDFLAGAFWTRSPVALKELIANYGKILEGKEMVLMCTDEQLQQLEPVTNDIEPIEERQMVMDDPSQLICNEIIPTHRLSDKDTENLRELYMLSGTPAWTPNALRLGPFFGVRDHESKVVAVAGVHFVSKYGAEIGNIATHPDHRRKGYAQCCVAAVTREILKTSERVLLHFFSDNDAAQKLYEKMGFAYSSADPVYFTKVTLV